MMVRRSLQPITKPALEALFLAMDAEIAGRGQFLQVTVLGGAAILLLGFRERVTLDVDIAATADAEAFQRLCATHGVPVDIITIASTVDLSHCPTEPVFQGRALGVHAVTATDLIKLKLERFRKQDPEDIEAIITARRLPFSEFLPLVRDMHVDYIGNVRMLTISAKIIVERMYPDHVAEFTAAFPNH